MSILDIHALLASALEFPSSYGHNWDAFNDCLNDDELSNPPVELIIYGWDIFLIEHLESAKHFWSCIENRGPTKKPVEVLTSPRTCPCCDYLTLSDPHIGSYEICPICDWQDDHVQNHAPNYEGGANSTSLRQARQKLKTKKIVTDSIKDFRVHPKP